MKEQGKFCATIKNSKKYKISTNKKMNGKCFFAVAENCDLDDFNAIDWESVKLLNDDLTLNEGLLDVEFEPDNSNVFALMEEGVLDNVKTGADIGIYDYLNQPTEDYILHLSNYIGEFKPHRIDDGDDGFEYVDDVVQDYNIRYCILAENNPLGNNLTKTITTFKGYLELNKVGPGILKNCNLWENFSNIKQVYISEKYISKYKLRNGDEIVCTCEKQEDKMVVNTIVTINKLPYFEWGHEREWFKELPYGRTKNIKAVGDYFKAFISKFSLKRGDNAFVYINKNTQKYNIMPKFITELKDMFDCVIYINPGYREGIDALSELNFLNDSRIFKFCSKFTDGFTRQQTVALMGINYAKRLAEMGINVGVVIDDLDAIMFLDSIYNGEMPICKTLLDSAKNCKQGSITLFTMASLRIDTADHFISNNIFKNIETVGIVIDNNEIDIFNSYRV